MPKVVKIKKVPISFRLNPCTVERLKSIDKYHSKIDTYINLGIDFENIAKLIYEDKNKLLTPSQVDFEENITKIHRYFVDNIWDNKNYSEDTQEILKWLYLCAFGLHRY